MTDASRRPPDGPRTPHPSRGLWILVLLLLAPAIVVPLMVPIYDRTDPTLFGFPFFYWFQFALILVAALLTITALKVSWVADRRDREARRDRGADR
ncbi:DUF3311 domain-containing protein [Nocardioides sp.]|uniref:DUF3311 domain-containing protein n=1 Tax=Nocardioides sp. TaxID=35761 RepID=UPI003563CA3D